MPASKLFHEAIINYGGKLSKNVVRSDAWDLLEELLFYFKELLKVSDKDTSNYPVANIYCNYIDNPSINAVAFNYKKCEFVGIFAGAYLLIWDTFLALLSSPKILREIGNPALETVKDENIAQHILHPRDGYYLALFPKDHVRYKAAQALSLNVMNFLLAHEVAHHAHGHLLFLKGEFEADSLIEYPLEPLYKKQLQIRRLLELDADMHAFRFSIDSWARLNIQGSFPELKELHFLQTWSFSLGIIFRLFDIHTRNTADYSRKPHPRPDIRFMYAYVVGLEEVKNRAPHLETSYKKSFHNSYTLIDKIWKMLKMPTQSFKTIDPSLSYEMGDLTIQLNCLVNDHLKKYTIKRIDYIKNA